MPNLDWPLSDNALVEQALLVGAAHLMEHKQISVEGFKRIVLRSQELYQFIANKDHPELLR